MNRTKIEWVINKDGTRGFTWNPVVGCYGVGCSVRKVCWAREFAKRTAHLCYNPKIHYDFIPHPHFERLNEPLRRKKPSGIFPVSMGDWLGVQIHYTRKVYEVMKKAEWHRFLTLTKQIQNLRITLAKEIFIPEHIWIGITVNSQKDIWRLEKLREICHYAHTFVSFEPLYSEIDYALYFVDWIIIGAQTRPNLQPKKEWVEKLIDEADYYGIPVFLKDNLEWDNKRQEIPYWKK